MKSNKNNLIIGKNRILNLFQDMVQRLQKMYKSKN